jgi:hypothetical protein
MKLEPGGEEEMADAAQRGPGGGAFDWHVGTEAMRACVDDEIGDGPNLLLVR